MMTIHRLSAGDGYAYYTNEVASADARRPKCQELGDYYLESGAPPGVWEGAEVTRHFGISGEVTEAQMRDLFGNGKRPDAEQIRQAKRGIVDESKLVLGAAYAVYPGFHQDFLDAVKDACEAELERTGKSGLRQRDRARIRREVALEMFKEDRGRAPVSTEELTRFITTHTRTNPQAVAGFDLTFSAPKSVSLLWALGDKPLREAVERAHTQAIRDTINFLEAEVIGSRAGRNGARRVAVDGIMAARFRHYDSRAGDPQLHDHLVVSNKVFVPFGGQDEDGKPRGVWRTIDSKALYKATVATSERYNNALMTHLADDLGIVFEQRGGGDRALKMEAACVPEALVEQFSSRRTSIKGRLAELVAEYKAQHGHMPTRHVTMRLAQQATLETRQTKAHMPLAQRMQQWRSATPARWTIESVRSHNIRVPQIDDQALAQRVISALEVRRSTWTRRHVQAEAARQIAAATGGRDCASDQVDMLTSRIMDHTDMVRLSQPQPVLHKARMDHNGVSVYDHPDMWRFTSRAVIARETRLLDEAQMDAVPPVSAETLCHVLTSAREQGVRLGADQERMVEAFTTSSKAVVTAVGPAGAGKTTAMRWVARAVEAQGGRLIGLAPSAVAAAELSKALGVEAMTAQRWLTREGWTQLRCGDVVLIDEAGMLDNLTLTAVTTRAIQVGAVVRMVGDPMQLGAVDAGGAFDLLHKITGQSIELERIWRLKNPDEADASLALRQGPARDAFAWYLANDRVKGGGESEILAEAHAAWWADHEAGRTSLIIASNTERVAALNDAVAAHRAAQGQTKPAAHQVRTRDGHTIRIGDIVLTRRNDTNNPYGRGDFVKNGDLLTVLDTYADGTVIAQAKDTSVITLAPDYVAEHVQLGYSSTVHRSQGVTVDVAHAVLDSSTDRSLAYVALTRGRESNHAWLVVDDDQPVTAALDTIAARIPDNITTIQAAAQEEEALLDPVTARDIYTDLDATANRIRWAEHLHEMARDGRIDPQAGRAPASDTFRELVTDLCRLETAGIDVDQLLSDLSQDMGEPEDPAALLSWRIQDWQTTHATVLDPQHAGPLADLDTKALDQVRAQAQAQAQQAEGHADPKVVSRSWQAAQTILEQVELETSRRRLRRPPEPGRDPMDGLTSWTAPSAALTDPYTPDTWRQALTRQRDILRQALDHAGRTALNQAEWAAGLCRPESIDPDHWHQSIGQIATWRATNRVGDHLPLNETARTNEAQDQPVHDLAQHVADAQPTSQADQVLAQAERSLSDARTREATTSSLLRARQVLDTGQAKPPQIGRGGATGAVPTKIGHHRGEPGPQPGMRPSL